MKKIVSATLAFAMMCTSTAIPSAAAQRIIGMAAVSASAEGTVVNAENVTLYAMNSTYDGVLSISTEFPQEFQLMVDSGADVTYSVVEGSSAKISSDGLIQPTSTVMYWLGGMGTSWYREGATARTEYNYGRTIIRATTAGKSYDVTVDVVDYAKDYADRAIDDYIAKNVTPDMTDYQKIEQACRMAASYDYSASHSSAASMIIYGGGDCWASTDLIIIFAKKLGFEAWAREGRNDPGAGSGHKNAMIYANGVYYEAEAGYSGRAPRSYDVTQRNSLYSYKYYSSDGYQVYQYDGQTMPESMELPSYINGKKIAAVGDKMFQSKSGIKEIIIPSTVVSIGDSAFNSASDLERVYIPASVRKIGRLAFVKTANMKEIVIDSDSAYFSSEGSTVFNKNKSMLYYVPELTSYTAPDSVTEVFEYALSYNPNLKTVAFNNARSFGEGVFANCNNLKSVTLNNVETIDRYVFGSCTSLTTIYLPKTVKTIEENAFVNSGLTDIYYEGTEAQWDAVSKDTCAAFANAAVHFNCSNTTDISACTISGIKAEYTFTGKQIKPAPVVKDGTKTLTLGTDYKLSYKNNTSCGTAACVIEGIGSYRGKDSFTYSIKSQLISKAAFTFSDTIYYDNTAHKPEPDVTYNGIKLVKDTDYTISYYRSNIKAGTGYCIIYGKGNFSGSVEAPFTITVAPDHKHSAMYFVSRENATCEAEGTVTYRCVCGMDYTETLPKKSHSYTSKVTKTATCKAAGIRTYTCSNCGDSYTETIAKKAHTYVTDTKAATCTEDGYTQKKCSECGAASERTVIEKTSHKYTSRVIAPTYSEQGYTLYTCSACGDSYKDKTAEKKVLAAPVVTSYSSAADAVRINWDKVEDASGYRVYRYNLSSAKWESIKTISGGDTLTYRDTDRNSAAVYKYKVKAYIKENGQTIWGDASAVYSTATKPAKAVISSISVSTTAARVVWKPVTGATGYKLQQSTDGKTWTTVKVVKDAAEYRVTGLKAGTTYKFRVCAYKSDGTKNVLGAYSAVVSAATKK